MGGGKRAFLATVALAVTGCTADDGGMGIRTIADPLAAASKRGSPMLAEARAALALGNVGTALEAFRKAQRQQPDSIEALAGIAACYERMGRYDLSRANFEAALAIAPNNAVLLNSFAASLQQQGKFAEANALRAEAAEAEAVEVADTVRMTQADLARAATPAPVPVQVAAPTTRLVQVAPVAPAPKLAPAAKPAPMLAPAVKPAQALASAAPPPTVSAPAAPAVPTPMAQVDFGPAAGSPAPAFASAAPLGIFTQVAPIAPEVEPIASSEAPVPSTAVKGRRKAPEAAPLARRVIHTEVVGNTEWTIEVPQSAGAPAPAPPVNSVTLTVPPARAPERAPAPVDPAPVAREAVPVREAAAPKSTPEAPARKNPVVSEVLAATAPQPRLQRLSTGEVALLTGDAPAWRTEVVAKSRRSVTARFVPLKPADVTAQRDGNARFVPLQAAMAANRPNIRLLNAARRQGLAARTRLVLVDRGWRRIGIGDADQVRARSIVLYPAGRQVLGRRLAAQFGFASGINRRSDEVLVLLGRDAAALSFRRARG